MRRYLGVVIAAVVLSAGISFAVAAQPAPDFQLNSLNNETITLSSFKNNKAVLLMFWTTWCPYCRDQLMSLNDKYAQLSKEGMEVLTINVGESPEKVAKFTKLRNLSLPLLLDRSSSVANSFEIMGVPTYILVDKKGYIAAEDNYFAEGKYKDLISK